MNTKIFVKNVKAKKIPLISGNNNQLNSLKYDANTQHLPRLWHTERTYCLTILSLTFQNSKVKRNSKKFTFYVKSELMQLLRDYAKKSTYLDYGILLRFTVTSIPFYYMQITFF